MYKWIGARDFMLVVEFLGVLALLYFITEFHFQFDSAAFPLDDNVARSIEYVDQITKKQKLVLNP